MAKYLIKASYTAEGLKGVLKGGGTARASAIEGALKGLGGSLDALYFAFGDDDVYVIVDMPDQASAMAMAATVGASGAISAYETVVLLEPAEVDAAMKIAVSYQPPGA